jgi:purine-nucleoside phosphorylase
LSRYTEPWDELLSTQIQVAADFLKQYIKIAPEIGMITGTGLGELTKRVEVDARIFYSDIPNFPVSTAEGHRGSLVIGTLAGRSIIAMEGRFHLYEGYAPIEITFPIRVMSKLGVKFLLISSAAGGLNSNFNPGDLMIITDHINFTGTNPLTGPNLEEFGPRFPDMSNVYDSGLINIAECKSYDHGITLHKGVYVGVLGPSLESRAETRFFKMIGADAIGMSTVHEVIAAVHCSLKIIAIAVITNINLPDAMNKTTIEDVINTANSASELLSFLWEEIISGLPGVTGAVHEII